MVVKTLIKSVVASQSELTFSGLRVDASRATFTLRARALSLKIDLSLPCSAQSQTLRPGTVFADPYTLLIAAGFSLLVATVC